MSILKFIPKLLKIIGYSVVDFAYNNWRKEFWLEVNPHKIVPVVPSVIDVEKSSGCLASREYGGMFLAAGDLCRKHGRVQENIPWLRSMPGLPIGLSFYC
jgi:hypothetical protein